MFIFIDKYRNVWYNTRCDVQSGMSQQTETRRVVRVVEGAALEISAEAGNFVPSKTLANSGFPKIQIEYFLAFSPAFLSKGFLSALETTRIVGGNRHGAISKWS